MTTFIGAFERLQSQEKARTGPRFGGELGEEGM
jgi:hypothetical protein